MYTAVILEPILEILRIIWLWNVGETDIVKLLPLHLCTMQMFFLPISVFYRQQTLREFTFFSSFLGGIMAIALPAGVCDTYPFFHFQTFQTLGVHTLLIFIPLTLLLFDNFYPNIKNLPNLFLFSTFAILPAIFIDFVFHENYMFLCTPPSGTIFVSLYDTAGQLGYQLFLFVSLSILIITCYVFFEYGRKKGLQKRLYRVI